MKKTTLALVISGVTSLWMPSTLAATPDLGDPSCDSLLLVSSWWRNNVKIYDGCSGTYVRNLDTQGLINGPLGILQAPDGDVLVISETNSRLLKFDYETLSNGTVIMGDDPNTEDVENNFITNPVGMAIAEDGTLYVGSYTRNNIVKIDTNEWKIDEEILPPNNGQVIGIDVGLLLDEEYLYVPGWDSHNVIKINLSNNQVSTAVAARSGGLRATRAILADGDDLIVSGEQSNAIYRYKKSNGDFKQKLIEINTPTGMRDDGDGYFIVSTFSSVYRISYDGTSSEQLIENGAGGLSGGTYVYRLYKTTNDDDNDGLLNDEENYYGTDPNNPDTDADSLNDGDEVKVHQSNPLSNDSDGDQIPDGYEVATGLLINTHDADLDPDEDWLTNLQEYQAGTHPFNPDTDGDGELDGIDADPLVPNSAPELSGTPATEVMQGDFYSFNPAVTYVGNMETVSLTITNKPSWADFDTASGALTGTPDNDDVGIYRDILIQATNGYHVVSLSSFNIEAINVNDPPVLTSSIPQQQFTVGQSVTINLAGYFNDIDKDDSLTFNASNLPSGLTLSSNGQVSGAPTTEGTNQVRVIATDSSGASVEANFNVKVSAPSSSGGSFSFWILSIFALRGIGSRLISRAR